MTQEGKEEIKLIAIDIFCLIDVENDKMLKTSECKDLIDVFKLDKIKNKYPGVNEWIKDNFDQFMKSST